MKALIAVLLFIVSGTWMVRFTVNSFLNDAPYYSYHNNAAVAAVDWVTSDYNWLQLVGILVVLAAYGIITAAFLHQPTRWSRWITSPFLLTLGIFFLLSGAAETLVGGLFLLFVVALGLVAGAGDLGLALFAAIIPTAGGIGSIWVSGKLLSSLGTHLREA